MNGCPNCGWVQRGDYCVNHVQCTLCRKWQEKQLGQGAHSDDMNTYPTYDYNGKELSR